MDFLNPKVSSTMLVDRVFDTAGGNPILISRYCVIKRQDLPGLKFTDSITPI